MGLRGIRGGFPLAWAWPVGYREGPLPSVLLQCLMASFLTVWAAVQAHDLPSDFQRDLPFLYPSPCYRGKGTAYIKGTF